MPDWLFEILASLAVAAVASLVTVELSLRRFHSERWWERKAEAYGRLMGAVADLRRYIDLLVEGEHGKGAAGDDKAALLAKHREASHELERATMIGQFLFSDETASLLKKHSHRMGPVPDEDGIEYFKREKAAYTLLCGALVVSAKADLRVT